MQHIITEEVELKTERQTAFFINRLKKKAKHLRRWAGRNGVHAYRIYGRDIPEVPVDVDLYENRDTGEQFLHVSFYRHASGSKTEEEDYRLKKMVEAASTALSIPPENIYIKTREKQRGEKKQYEKLGGKNISFYVEESGSSFKVNLSDYLDTGLFLDHRNLRLKVKEKACGKRVLNLFCYTGSFSVHAAAGGALSVTSVDLSKTYLARAKENMLYNGFSSGIDGSYEFICSDVMEFLRLEELRGKTRKWDIIICDPPTFSNSKRTEKILDTGRDWAVLCNACLEKLEYGGSLYFSTNSKKLRFDREKLTPPAGTEILCKDITEESTPEDFRGKRPHRCWEITLKKSGNG